MEFHCCVCFRCLSKASLILDSQLPKGMESLQKIQNLEDKERRDGVVEEVKRQAPVFTVPLNNVAGLREGENAHFEGRLTPTDDPKLQVLDPPSPFPCFEIDLIG